MKAATAAALSLLLVACSKPAPRGDGRVLDAEFGIFFGGQLEQRREIPFQVDRAKQTQGFRIDFDKPLAHAHQISWAISMPGGGGSRVRRTQIGQAEVQAGQKRLDHPMPFSPGDALGVWNIRVMVDHNIVIDRMVRVYDAERRARERAKLDGGT